jgi:hypothetical protein
MVRSVTGARVALVRVVTCLLCAATLLTLAAAVARADVFAAVEVQPPGSRQDFDIEVVDAATGAQVPLPAGVNTTADELHPSISTDGSRLVFERRDSAAGTVRIIAVDVPTGHSSDLFTGFDVAQNPPRAPAITPDGQTVATGGPFQTVGTGGFLPRVTATSLAPFPTGPYVHQNIFAGSSSVNGQIADVAAGPGGLYALRTVESGKPDLLLLDQSSPPTGLIDTNPVTGVGSFSDPALAASNPQFVLFARRDSLFFAPGDIAFVPLSIDQFGLHFGTPTRLPAVVNSSLDESQPAVTADGRFIAFVRHGADGHDHLFLWDSQTQLLLNPDGVDLGAISSRDVGNVSVYTQPVFSIAQVTTSQISPGAPANIAVRVGQGGSLGILVQRIVGRQRILGRRAYKLRKVGRVPLGHFTKGTHHLHWNLRVNGKRLRPGRYLVTLRALSNSGVIRDMATPNVLRIR